MSDPRTPSLVERLEKLTSESESFDWPDTLVPVADVRTVLALLRKAEEAMEPWERHGRACGALGGDDGPFRVYTDTGHRDVPPEDFRRLAAVLAEIRGMGA